ncbi:MAG: hypothetical protein K5873_10470 [Treponema sp.]|nr:hypothetical protein [Treponema sp.]
MKRFLTVSFLIFFFFPQLALSQSPVQIMEGEVDYLFNDRLSEKELLDLRNGGVVCNSIRKLKYSRINEIPETKALLDAVDDVDPNHLAEIIKILPYRGYENLTQIVSDMLKSEESYTKVPFYTRSDGSIRYLYELAEIQGIEILPEKEVIKEKFHMLPLDPFTGKIEAEKRGSYFFYHMRNQSKIKYKGLITAVGKENMIAVISIFRYGDNWIIYALGGVDIIPFPFISGAIDRAFYNRISAFCLFTFERLEEFVSKDGEN